MTLQIPLETSAAHDSQQPTRETTALPQCLRCISEKANLSLVRTHILFETISFCILFSLLLTFPMVHCHQISWREVEEHLVAKSPLVFDKACEGYVIRVACFLFIRHTFTQTHH